jgi:hypothetical protein
MATVTKPLVLDETLKTSGQTPKKVADVLAEELRRIASAIGGTPYVEVTGTLTAGQTSITLQDSSITTSSTIDYYTDTFGVSPTDAVVTTGQIVLTFDEQANDLGVKVRVS